MDRPPTSNLGGAVLPSPPLGLRLWTYGRRRVTYRVEEERFERWLDREQLTEMGWLGELKCVVYLSAMTYS